MPEKYNEQWTVPENTDQQQTVEALNNDAEEVKYTTMDQALDDEQKKAQEYVGTMLCYDF